MNERPNLTTAKGRLPELDGLRAIAILLVLFYHSSVALPVGWLRNLGTAGWTGVDLFFVLSGFLIGGILLDQRSAPNYYGVFYLRRFFRIVPLYALILLPGLLILGLGLQRHFASHSLADQSPAAIWACPLFIQNITASLGIGLPKYLVPTWSIAVEEQFYLLLPLVIRLADPKHLWKILASAIVAAPLLRGILFLVFGRQAGVACYDLLPCRWDGFLLGVMGALALRQPAWRDGRAGNLRGLRCLWFASGVAATIFLACNHNNRLDPEMAFAGYTVIDIFFASTLMIAVMHPAGRLGRALRLRIFGPIAAVSYGLYLIHSPMLALTESFMRMAHISYAPTSWMATVAVSLSLAGTAVAAAVSWKFFESPLIRLGHRHRFTNGGAGKSIESVRKSVKFLK